MKNVLVVIGHPFWEKSVANRGIVEALRSCGHNITFSNLKELYPNGRLNVAEEQAKLLAADIIVLQYPVMWFGAPSLMHRYFEEILTYGFAYGNGNYRLTGKPLIASFTTGAAETAYSGKGGEGYTMDEFIVPVAATATYCKMKWSGYVCSCGMMNPSSEAIENHVKRLSDKIAAL